MKGRNGTITVLLLSAAALTLAGCHREEPTGVPRPVRFIAREAGLGVDVTKSATAREVGTFRVLDMLVDSDGGTGTALLYNQEVTKGESSWSYTPLKYWPKTTTTGNIYVNAVSPAEALTSSSRVYAESEYRYTVPEDGLATPDLLYASYTYDGSGSGHTPFNGTAPVALTFAHMLSRIEISVATRDEGATARLTEFTLSGNFHGGGLLDKTDTLWAGKSALKEWALSPATATGLIDNDGKWLTSDEEASWIFVMPTKATPIGITLGYTYDGTGGTGTGRTVAPKTLGTTLTFEQGHTYRLEVLLGAGRFEIVSTSAGSYGIGTAIDGTGNSGAYLPTGADWAGWTSSSAGLYDAGGNLLGGGNSGRYGDGGGDTNGGGEAGDYGDGGGNASDNGGAGDYGDGGGDTTGRGSDAGTYRTGS